jgi:hypothetical protein
VIGTDFVFDAIIDNDILVVFLDLVLLWIVLGLVEVGSKC